MPFVFAICTIISCKPPNPDNTILLFSCLDNGGNYQIDTKITVTFDTVFTSIGSVTKHFKVHNTSNQDIITTLFLAGGERSLYSINVNGVPGADANNYFKNVEIPKKDSIFIFVKVNINPLNQNNPFLVTDAIVFLTGDIKQEVELIAYGQDARYIVADPSTGFKVVAGEHETVHWTKERPYVVYGWAAIDSTGTLVIEPGTRIFFHRNSGLWAYRYSKLEINGTLEEPVLLRGDRLEAGFENDFAQWDRVWINEGASVSIDYAVISNAFIGVQVDPLPNNKGEIAIVPTSVNIKNTIIKNTHNSGVLARFLSLNMTNCLIINNGGCGMQLECGQYSMKHLTIANYFKGDRKTPACYVSNKVSDPLFEAVPALNTKVDFINCIIYGNHEKDEPEVVVGKTQGAELEATFQNSLLKAKFNPIYFKDCFLDEDPQFVDVKASDFQLQSTSPAIGKGKPDIEVLLDILGKPRGDKPDLGAYQFGR